MKKALKIIGITLVALFIVAMLVLNFFLGDIVEQAVRKGGPMVLGVPVKLESADMRLLRGKSGITGLSDGNPEGCKTDNLFSLGSIKIDIAPASIFSDTIHIRSIEIVAPEISYERGLKSSNISALIDSLEGEETDKEEPEEENDPGRLHDLRSLGVAVRLARTMKDSSPVSKPSPTGSDSLTLSHAPDVTWEPEPADSKVAE